MSFSRRQLIKAGAASVTGLFSVSSLLHADNHQQVKKKAAFNLVSYKGPAFGTQWQLTLDHNDQQDLVSELVINTIQEIDRAMSPYRRDSELTAFNRLENNTPMELSAGCSHVVSAALDVARASAAAFDPTVGPWVNRLGYGPIKGNLHSSINDISLQGNTLTKSLSGTTLDLCGIAKGYALDRIAGLLKNAGVESFLLNIGGELSARGYHPSGREWLVGIAQPQHNAGPANTTLLVNTAIATSGSTHNGFTFGKEIYSHLIGRQRQLSVAPGLHSVSVKHDSAMLADAWSTALYVMGLEDGVVAAKAMSLDTLFIGDNTTQFQVQTTGCFGLSESEEKCIWTLFLN